MFGLSNDQRNDVITISTRDPAVYERVRRLEAAQRPIRLLGALWRVTAVTIEHRGGQFSLCRAMLSRLVEITHADTPTDA